MAEEKRVRVVFEAVGGAAAADDASRFRAAVDGLAQSEGAAAASTDALEAKIAELQQRVTALQQAQARGNQTQQDFSRVATEATQKAIEFTGKVAAAAGAVQSLAGALGQEGGAAGLIASIAGAAAAGAQLGATFGPQGAIVGGIAGALIPALSELISYNEEVAASAERARQEQELLAAASARYDRERQRFIDRAVASGRMGGLTDAEIAQQRRLAEERIAQLGEDIQEMERQRDRAGEESARHYQDGIDDATEALRRQLMVLGNLAEAQGQAEARVNAERLRSERGGGTPARSGGGRDRFAEEQAAWEAYQDAIDRGLAQELEARQRVADMQQRQLDLLIEAADKVRELQDAAIRAAQEEKAAFERVDAERREREDVFARDSLQRLQSESRERTEQLDRETAKREEDLAVFGELAGGISRSLVVAVSEVTSGAKTAEEAFKGMLASFLTSIAEQALISAMKEYAEAIAAFARYDFGGGAGHVAAGLAFTGVAVATGAAAGAVAAPSQGQTQPDRPDSMAANDGNYGRTVFVNNWNAPTIAAGTEADVGRTFDRFGRRAAQRFGRIAA